MSVKCKAKRILAISIVSMITILTSACTSDTSMVENIKDKQDNSSVQNAPQAENNVQNDDDKSKTDGEEAVASEANKNNNENSNSVDVDLTKLSSTMVYSEVYNMMVNPEDYMGKTIKIIGQYSANQLEEGGKYYHFVVISDATACCQNGIEFIWGDNSHVYPDEYPDINAVVEVTGVFSSYEEAGETYYYLKTDGITVK